MSTVTKRRFAHKDHATGGQNAGYIWTFNESGVGAVMTCDHNKIEDKRPDMGIAYAEELVANGMWIELEPLRPDTPATQANEDAW